MTLIAVSMGAGLAVRFVPLGLPNAFVKYGGSLLWAMMIYWIVSTIGRRWPLCRAALVAFAIALSVEVFKLYHTPALDAFRLSLAGKLLLGRVFSPLNLIAYAIAIVAACLADRAIRLRLASNRGVLPSASASALSSG